MPRPCDHGVIGGHCRICLAHEREERLRHAPQRHPRCAGPCSFAPGGGASPGPSRGLARGCSFWPRSSRPSASQSCLDWSRHHSLAVGACKS